MRAQTRNIRSYLMLLNNNLYAQEVGLATGARTSSLLAVFFSFFEYTKMLMIYCINIISCTLCTWMTSF